MSLMKCYCDFKVVGTKGQSGGDGGDGGVGGIGGNAGKVVMVGLNKTPNLRHFNNTGNVHKRSKRRLNYKFFFLAASAYTTLSKIFDDRPPHR